MSKVKIVTFSHYGELYGANRSLLTLLLGTQDKIDWWVICRKPGHFTEELLKNNIRYTQLEFHNDVYQKPHKSPVINGIVKLLHNTYLATKIGRQLSREKYNIIHTNSSVTFIGAIVALLFSKKHIWHLREFVYEDYGLKYNLGKKAFDYFARKATALLCISESIKHTRVEERRLKVNSPILYNGLPKPGNFIPKNPSKETIPVLSIIGVVNEAKNQLVAVKAVALLIKKGMPVKLKIAGHQENSPVYYHLLTRYIAEENLSEFVEFIGFKKNISDVFSQTDILLMCSENEAFGRVTVESMMHGVPVIAYAAAGSKEIITDGKNGLLYCGGESALVEQVEKLLHDKAFYTELSANALAHAEANFSIENYTNGFVGIVNAIDANRNLKN